MTATIKPIPCPFCGWIRPRVQRMEHEKVFAFMVACQRVRCLASGPVADTSADAVRAWNRRKDTKR